MYRSILLPLDGSLFSEHAFPVALETARRAGAVLHVVHVYQMDEPWRDMETLTPYRFEGELEYEGVYESEERRLARRYLDWVAGTARERGVQARSTLLDGDATEAIQRYAQEAEADLVVMATHGRGALRRAWLGSVADAVVRELGRPTLLVRPPEDGRPDPDRRPDFSHVLVPLDGSDEAEQILAPALALGALWRARFTLLTVVPHAIPLGTVNPALVFDEREELPGERGGAAQDYLDEVAERLRRDGHEVEARVVVDANVTEGILTQARRLHATLIAVSTHGRSGLSRLVMGSVAGEVVRESDVPVLVYRPTA